MIEKFGVPPEKVIEVQSLIGDSTDNVPGVPGIGVKTAAQLIGEYGDLETLLARASEIKQEKRRQALIENAEQARLSKKLVTLDDHVALDVPIDDLAVHEPDYKRLIAFLKAMEFTTLTRRVAEFAGIDAAPDRGGRRQLSSAAPPRQGEGRRRGGQARPRDLFPAPRLPLDRRRRRPSHATARERRRGNSADAAGARRRARSKPRATPSSIAARYEIVRSLDRLNAWIARARDIGVVAIDTADHEPRSDAGDVVRLLARGRAERGLLRAAGPPPGRRRRQRRPVPPVAIAPDQIEERDALDGVEAAARGSGRAQDRQRPEIRPGRFSRCAASSSRPTTTPC